jgi:hypothetical protein
MMSPIEFTNHKGEQDIMATPEIDELVEIVSGKKPSDRKALAIEILRYVAQRRAETDAKTWCDGDVGLCNMMLNFQVPCLWTYGLVRLKTINGEDGVERLEIEKVQRDEPLPPAPVPIPTAIPLPVLPISDVEKEAIKEINLTFDERYSPAAVAARIAAIEREAAAMRAAREQTE